MEQLTFLIFFRRALNYLQTKNFSDSQGTICQFLSDNIEIMKRKDGRKNDELRPIKFTPDFASLADGSVLVEFGNTKVLVTAQIEEKVPQFLENTGKGWITAEYSLLPGSTKPRSQREATKGKQSGRTTEIQRLIGRSLRAGFNLDKLGPRTITVDADVICADASTRVVSICGGFIAVYKALLKLKEREILKEVPIISPVAAVSVGMINGELLLDLTYDEDSKAEIDSNIVMNKKGELIEFQITSERKPFNQDLVFNLIKLAKKGIDEIIQRWGSVLKS